MKNKINLTKLICIAVVLFIVTGCNEIASKKKGTYANSTENVLNLPFSKMTITYNGKSNVSNEPGKLALEKTRIIMDGLGGHKEWFKINSIVVEPKSIRFATNNSKDEEAIFFIIFNGDTISQIKTEMFDVNLDYGSRNDTLSRTEILQFYSEIISTLKPGRYIETKRDDGLTTKMYEPLIVKDSDGIQIALAFMTSEVGNYISVILQFEDKMRMLDGDLALRLNNDELLRFSPESIKKTNIGRSDGIIGLFKCPQDQSNKLKDNSLTNISLSFEGGALNTYNIESNNDVLAKQIRLLN